MQELRILQTWMPAFAGMTLLPQPYAGNGSSSFRRWTGRGYAGSLRY
jgi:surfactin synthase thioesterase subunit